METAFIKAVDDRSAKARAAGVLQRIDMAQFELTERGLRFAVRWVPSQSGKGAAESMLPGGPRDPHFNPFLPPDSRLAMGLMGEHHNVVLNKYPVCDRHLVLSRVEFEEQRAPLSLEDFHALSRIMSGCGGLGFYIGGPNAGASQRHKHVQWLPDESGNPGLRFLAQGLPQGLPQQAMSMHPDLPFKHLFARVLSRRGTPPQDLAERLHKAFQRMSGELGMTLNAEGLLPACNMLVQDDWMLVVPRRRESAFDVSVNALSYGGVLYARTPEHVESIRRAGPLAVLAEAGCPLGE